MSLGFLQARDMTDKVPCLKCPYRATKRNANWNWKGVGQNAKSITIVTSYPLFLPDETESCGYRTTSEGALYARTLARLGIDLKKDARCVSVFPCEERGHGRGDKEEAASYTRCGRHFRGHVKSWDAKLVFCFGKHALKYVIQSEWSTGFNPIDRWVGFQIPYADRGYRVLPLWDLKETSANNFLREQMRETYLKFVDEYVGDALDSLATPLKKLDLSGVNVLEEDEALTILRSYVDVPPAYFVFDFETTGVKLWNEGHKLVSVGIATNLRTSYSFFLTEPIIALLKKILVNPNVNKLQANLKYEDMCSFRFFGVTPKPWVWDTMIASHVLNMRPSGGTSDSSDDVKAGVSSLKFQAFVKFGVPEYNSSIKKYLKSGEKNKNAMNSILQIKKGSKEARDLLYYGGIDALACINLFSEQTKEIEKLNARHFHEKSV